MKGNIRLYVSKQHIQDARTLNRESKRKQSITPVHLALAEKLAKETDDFSIQFNGSKIFVEKGNSKTVARKNTRLDSWLKEYKKYKQVEPTRFSLNFECM